MFAQLLKEIFSRPAAGLLTCQLCGYSAPRFDPLDPGFQRIALEQGFPYWGREEMLNHGDYHCPQCRASDRQRLAWLFLDAELRKVPAGSKVKVLHVAPEIPLAFRLSRNSQVELLTFDLQREDVDVRGDLCDMTMFRDGSFQGIVCLHVLEHVRDDRRAMAELHRVLAPGGWGVVLVPLYPRDVLETHEDWSKTSEADRWRHFGGHDHVRLYAKSDFVSRLEVAGFRVEQLGVGHFGAKTFAQHAITAQSVLYVVRKP